MVKYNTMLYEINHFSPEQKGTLVYLTGETQSGVRWIGFDTPCEYIKRISGELHQVVVRVDKFNKKIPLHSVWYFCVDEKIESRKVKIMGSQDGYKHSRSSDGRLLYIVLRTDKQLQKNISLGLLRSYREYVITPWLSPDRTESLGIFFNTDFVGINFVKEFHWKVGDKIDVVINLPVSTCEFKKIVGKDDGSGVLDNFQMITFVVGFILVTGAIFISES